MKLSTTFAIVLAASLSVGPFTINQAQAAGCAAPINARQHNQDARIVRGALSGELTVVETARLGAQQRRIDRVEDRYRSNDGRLGPAERCDLNRRLNNASGSIYRNKHDRQRYR